MHARTIAVAVAAFAAAAVLAVGLANGAEPSTPPLGDTPVVVEFFTSQGCSTCPPADKLIAAIVRDESLRGKVIPLAYHVDYWDRREWRDPFSSRAGTERQLMYVRAMHLRTSYTPHAVVAGRREFIGSNGAAIHNAVLEASNARPFGSISVDATREGDKVVANVKAAGPGADVMLALVEYDVTTEVKGGENKGRTIVNEAIVRSLARVSPGRTTLKADPSWKQLGVVAFLQDRDTLAIQNAASVRLP
jgi:hypothetical protein